MTANSCAMGIFDCPVLSLKNLVGDIYLMRLSCPKIAEAVEPGQFVNIKVNNECLPLLRKPFSVCRRNKDEGWFEVLWKIVGKGTAIMAGYQIGELINVIGPLGRGYTIPPGINTALLVGGGLGVAPLPFLCHEVKNNDKEAEVFLGAKTATELSMVDAFQEMGVKVHISTEDGSIGKHGLVTEILHERLEQISSTHKTGLYSCGPNPFLRAMANISEQRGIAGQIAIETMMGCGFGICVGCPVRVKDRTPGSGLFKLTCIDGPVFNATEIILDG